MKTYDYLMFDSSKLSFKNEADFTRRHLGEIKKRGGFARKISDMDIRKKPFDAMFSINGKHGYIEYKIGDVKKKSDIGKKLLPHQHNGLNLAKNNGANAIVIFYNKHNKKYYIREYNREILVII